MKEKIDMDLLPPHTAGNDRPRFVFAGGYWREWDLRFCMHGLKLRWLCDFCEAMTEDMSEREVLDVARRGNHSGWMEQWDVDPEILRPDRERTGKGES